MKRKLRLTYIQLCRYRRKTWLSHSVLLDAQNNHSYCSLFWRPFGKTRTNNTVYIIAAKAKLSDTHFSLGHAIHELQSVLQFGLGILLYLISNNTFMMDCSTIFDIISGWWTAQLFRYWWDQMYIFTLFEIFIFCPKIQLWFPEKIVDFFGWKNSWKCCGFALFSCWQLWFHEKICQKNFVKVCLHSSKADIPLIWRNILAKQNSVFWVKCSLFLFILCTKFNNF